jgi:hypothetical protein
MIAEITISDVTSIITAIVAGVVAIIGSLVAGFIAIRTSQKASDKSNNEKLDEIHTLTNSNLTSVKKELADLRALVELNAAKGVVTESKTVAPQ